MKMIFLVVNTGILLFFTLTLAYLVAKNISLKSLIKAGIEKANGEYSNRKLKRELNKYSRSISVKLGWLERFELYFIDKSNVRHYIKFFNVYVLLLIMLAIFLVTFEPVYKVVFFVPTTAVVCSLFTTVPLLLLDLLGRYNSESVRRLLNEFVSILKGWCSIRNDIFYAFEKSVDSGLEEPLNTFIKEFNIQVRRGIDPMEALDILALRVDNPQFRDFIINIKQNIKHRGDTVIVLSSLEDQFYKIEKEYNRRKISTYKDRVVSFVAMFLVLIISYFFLKSDPKVETFYFGTTTGKMLLTAFSLMFAGGFYFSLGITKFKY